MGIGASIFLLVIGAILTFAVRWSVAGLDLQVVGWVLMIAGAAGLVLFFLVWNRRRTPGAGAPTGTVTTERRTYDDSHRPPG